MFPFGCGEKNNKKIDYDWYLKNQILSSTSRICECIEGLSSSQLATCLGVSIYIAPEEKIDHSPLSHYQAPISKYEVIEKLFIKCAQCLNTFEFLGAYSEDVSKGLECPKCSFTLSEAKLSNNVNLYLRKQIKKYYLAKLSCSCSHQTSQLFLCNKRLMPKCIMYSDCKKYITETCTAKSLHLHMRYIYDLFCISQQILEKNIPDMVKNVYQKIHRNVIIEMDKSEYDKIDLKSIFSFYK